MSAGSRLGVVLRRREMDEKAARADVARAVALHHAALDATAGAREAARAAHEETARLQRASARGGLAVGDLAAAIAAAQLAEHEVAAAEVRAADAADRLAEARDHLAEASKQRDVVDRLLERIATTARHQAQRREDATLNEIASVRHVLGSIGEPRS